MSQLPQAHGIPPLIAKIRQYPEDFRVSEVLGFEPSGEGEHALLSIRKRETNTVWLAQQLARFAAVKPVAVGYAGLKDRHAVTTQSFSVQLPGQDSPDWGQLDLPGVEVLSQVRHNKKLKTGALKANRFELLLREVEGDRAQAEQVLQAISAQGVPNYFGEQRFGLDGHNVQRALAMFQGKRVDRKTRGLLLSAARSQIFNAVLAQRVSNGQWNVAMPGEVWALDGSRSWFVDDAAQTDLPQRLQAKDIHPSGPLWGRGELPSRSDLAQLERGVATSYAELAEGLERAGLSQDRRGLRLIPRELSWEWPQERQLRLRFELPPGCYATVVLRELAVWEATS